MPGLFSKKSETKKFFNDSSSPNDYQFCQQIDANILEPNPHIDL